MERNGFSYFGSGSPNEPSCKIISKSMHWLRRRSHLKVFLFLALVAILFNGAEWFSKSTFWFGRRSRLKVFLFLALAKIDVLVKEEKLFKGFSIFSSDGHLVQWSGTV